MRYIHFCFLCLAMIITSCKDDDATSGTSSGTQQTGTLRGKVSLYDARSRLVSDRSGVLVQFEGTPYSTVSDTGGNWSVSNLPTATYSISFSKPGYATFKNTSYSFIGGGIVRYNNGSVQYLYQPPQYTITIDAIIPPKNVYSDSLKKMVQQNGYIYGHTSDNTPDSVSLQVLYVTSHKPNFDPNDPTSYTLLWGNQITSSSLSDSIINIALNNWPGEGVFTRFSSGDSIYIRAYPASGSSYYDIKSDRTIIVGLGPSSNLLSAVIP